MAYVVIQFRDVPFLFMRDEIIRMNNVKLKAFCASTNYNRG